MNSFQSILKIVLKITFSVALIYWLIQSGKLNFELLNQLLDNTKILITSMAILVVLAMVLGYRFQLILGSRLKKKLPTLKLMHCHFIGLFFNTVLPGSVTGDVVKTFYYKKALHGQLSTSYMVGAVIFDRLLGLISLIFVAGSVSLVNFSRLSAQSPELANLLYFNLFLFLAGALGLLFIFLLPYFGLADFLKAKLKLLVLRQPFMQKIQEKLETLINEIVELRAIIVKLISISLITQASGVILFWWLTRDFSQGVFELHDAFSFVPIGMITIAIPIAPSGMGVGHVVFHQLFSYFNITNGASLFNLYFLLVISVNLLGVFPYLLTKKSSKNVAEILHDQKNDSRLS